MSGDELNLGEVSEITDFVDIEAPPPENEPTALFLFGTNQVNPVEIAARRFRQGLAPLIIVTGGVNRHDGIVEGQVFRQQLMERGVPDSVIRCEDRAANTWENVEFTLPDLQEARESGLKVTAVSKWFHRRTLHCLATLAPELGEIYAVSWEPIYGGRLANRADWPFIPDGKRRVVREWVEVSRRVAEGSFKSIERIDGAWQF
ncbi:YdcF family protein [Streptomyces sp. NPDC048290]|uniref:YdcF family protein n=1 Tax=Streptomyces sp. NPDC048290 TaxID=3155811 RepID=UPI00341A7DC5